jgi:serine/threonine-protein kinase RsbW
VQRAFPRDIRSLGEIFRFVRESLESEGIPAEPAVTFWVDLIVEELFTNAVKYGGESGRDVAIHLNREDDSLVIRLTDFEAREFDITTVPEVDTAMPLSERKAGGLGLHLVRRIADDVSYEYKDRTSTITVTKRLEGAGA